MTRSVFDVLRKKRKFEIFSSADKSISMSTGSIEEAASLALLRDYPKIAKFDNITIPEDHLPVVCVPENFLPKKPNVVSVESVNEVSDT